MIKNFIFDVDRTLVDSYKVELETLREALRIVMNINYDLEIMNQLTILTTEEFFKKIGIDKNSDTMKAINYHWDRLLKEKTPKLFPEIKKLLEYLKETGCFLGIATSRTKEELEELDELLECMKLFDIVITSDLIKEPKPNPESINIIIDKYVLDKKETIYVGDSPSDQIASSRAQIKFGFASWENKNEVLNYDYKFESPKDIYKIISEV